MSLALKSIRKDSGLSLQAMADRMKMPVSTYRHYEERYKEAFLPQDTVLALVEAMSDKPELQERAIALGQLPNVSTGGFSEQGKDYGPHARGRRLIEALSGGSQSEPDILWGSDGHRIQITATVDKAGIDKLISKLQIMKNLID